MFTDSAIRRTKIVATLGPAWDSVERPGLQRRGGIGRLFDVDEQLDRLAVEPFLCWET